MFKLKFPMARLVTDDELASLQRKRAEAIRLAGAKWLLHPSNFVPRKQPPVKPLRVLLCFVLFICVAGVENNDCDGRIPISQMNSP